MPLRNERLTTFGAEGVRCLPECVTHHGLCEVSDISNTYVWRMKQMSDRRQMWCAIATYIRVETVPVNI